MWLLWGVYRKIDELTSHINMENFYLCLFVILGYDKATFDIKEYSAQQETRNAFVEAAALARSAAAEAHQAQAAAAVASTSFLRGNLFHPPFPSMPSMESIVESVVARLYTTVSTSVSSSVGASDVSVPTVVCVDSFFSSVSMTTTSTVTATSGTSLENVYTVHGLVTSASLAIPLAAASATTPFRDEPAPDGPQSATQPGREELQTPVPQVGPYQPAVAVDPFSPPASGTLFMGSPPFVRPSVPAPVFASAQAIPVSQPVGQNYTSFESLFPLPMYPSSAATPTS